MWKINYKRKAQQRRLLLSNLYLYNLGGDELIHKVSGIVSKIFGDGAGKIRRKLSLNSIKHVTYSDFVTSTEFIIHVPSEFDYHFKGDYR